MAEMATWFRWLIRTDAVFNDNQQHCLDEQTVCVDDREINAM